MPYELIKKFTIENPPCPCDYCNSGWGDWSAEGIETCDKSCERYQAWVDGEIVIPDGFDEVRKI